MNGRRQTLGGNALAALIAVTVTLSIYFFATGRDNGLAGSALRAQPDNTFFVRIYPPKPASLPRVDPPQIVRSARQAEKIAARNTAASTADADPRNWLASFDRKQNRWTACAARPRSLPQSGFCVYIDARTGRQTGVEIFN